MQNLTFKEMSSPVSLCLPLVGRTSTALWSKHSYSLLKLVTNVPLTLSCPYNPMRTVKLTFDPTPHTGATSFINWMWSVVIEGVERTRGFGSIRTLEGGLLCTCT